LSLQSRNKGFRAIISFNKGDALWSLVAGFLARENGDIVVVRG